MKFIFITISLLFCLLLTADLADAEITVSSGSVVAGDSIAITVNTSNLLEEWDVISFQFDITYDPSSVAFSSYDFGDVFSDDGMLLMNELEPGYFRAAYSYYLAQSGSGAIAVMNFIGITDETTINIHDFKYNATFIENSTDGQITVIGGDELPVADAGADQTVNEGELVLLNGSNSYDPEGAAITYLWTADPSIVFNDPANPEPEFTAPAVTEDTEFTVTLTVNDGNHDSLPDELLITVLNVYSSDEIPQMITEVGISCISPNPFNPHTTISYLVPAGENTLDMKIYSVKGQLVKTFHLNSLPSNTEQQITWNGIDNNGSEAASGVYFCHLKGKSSSSSARMLLLK